MKFLYIILLLFTTTVKAQYININNDYLYEKIRTSIIDGTISTNYSLNIRPIKAEKFDVTKSSFKTIFDKKNILIKSLGLDYFIEFNSNHPYKRNNGTMIPNRGYQHIISPGIFFKLGPLTIKLKPEHHFSQNKDFNGFWNDHYPEIWAKRYRLWNHIDMPERYGEIRHNSTNLGQSSIRLNWKKISFGISNENIWWGPSLRNSIMMSNNASGFKHITFNTNEPIQTFLGNFEWQFITGRLESSGYNPPNTDYEYAGTKLYAPKINQLGQTDDWRFLQGFIFSYSPKWIDGLSLGFIRWVQMYSALIEGKYTWMNRNTNYFPAFQNLFRSSDKFVDYEAQTNQAAGLFLKWFWKDSKAEIYAEFHHNDSKQNLRDLLSDSDHSRAVTLGIQKIFWVNKSKILFNWEWTQMEQTASRIIRNAASWYEHAWVYDGYTNKGEVLGSTIGPGSNSHFFSLNKYNNQTNLGLGFEIVDNDNDFYYEAFSGSKDYRRYWKDFNFHINFHKQFKNFVLSSNLVFIRSLNYQWELDDNIEPYYHAGKDVNNLHLNLKFTYFGKF